MRCRRQLVGAARPENELQDADWIGLLDLIVAFKMARHCRVGRNALDRVFPGAAVGFKAIQRASRRGLGVREFEFSTAYPAVRSRVL